MIHPTAIISPVAMIGRNVTIHAFTQVLAGTVIKSDTVIGHGCFIGKDVSIGWGCKIQGGCYIPTGVIIHDDVFIGPNVTFTNVKRPRASVRVSPRDFKTTIIGKGVSIGAGAVIICGNGIGQHCMVGAGAVVTKNFIHCHNTLLVGIPARIKERINKDGTTDERYNKH